VTTRTPPRSSEAVGEQKGLDKPGHAIPAINAAAEVSPGSWMSCASATPGLGRHSGHQPGRRARVQEAIRSACPAFRIAKRVRKALIRISARQLVHNDPAADDVQPHTPATWASAHPARTAMTPTATTSTPDGHPDTAPQKQKPRTLIRVRGFLGVLRHHMLTTAPNRPHIWRGSRRTWAAGRIPQRWPW
jgi:hypothetical protein